jgi:hypothetical protein
MLSCVPLPLAYLDFEGFKRGLDGLLIDGGLLSNHVIGEFYGGGSRTNSLRVLGGDCLKFALGSGGEVGGDGITVLGSEGMAS